MTRHASVAEALLYLEKQPYTCVLTDLIMPEQSGLDLLRDVVSSHPDIAVILVSGQNDTAQVRRALKNGAYDYLVKPSTAGEIVATVDAALKKRQQYLKEQTDRQSLRERVEIGMVESILFEDIVRSTIDGIMITDLENRIIMVNPAYERLTGFLRQELIGTIPEILKGNRSSMDFGRRVAYELCSSGYWSGEVIDRRKDGAEWYANLTISRVKDSRGKGFCRCFCGSRHHGQEEHGAAVDRTAPGSAVSPGCGDHRFCEAGGMPQSGNRCTSGKDAGILPGSGGAHGNAAPLPRPDR